MGKKQRSFVDALHDWPSVNFTLARLIEVAPRIEPRLYSIASSPKVRSDSVELLMGVVRYDLPDGRVRAGLASTMIAGKTPDSSAAAGDSTSGGYPQSSATALDPRHLIICKVKQAPNMRLPNDPAAGAICVCGGTGLAPFRGFLQECAARKAAGDPVGKLSIYFGCRDDYDAVCLDDLNKWTADGICTVSVSYSRKAGVAKEYVYHALKRDSEKVRAALAEDAKDCFYVCGSASTLAKDSVKTLHEILGNGDLELGMKQYDKLQAIGRIVLDVWG